MFNLFALLIMRGHVLKSLTILIQKERDGLFLLFHNKTKCSTNSTKVQERWFLIKKKDSIHICIKKKNANAQFYEF